MIIILNGSEIVEPASVIPSRGPYFERIEYCLNASYDVGLAKFIGIIANNCHLGGNHRLPPKFTGCSLKQINP